MAINNMRAIYPGEILRAEYLAPLAMSANALSIHLGVAELGQILKNIDLKDF